MTKTVDATRELAAFPRGRSGWTGARRLRVADQPAPAPRPDGDGRVQIDFAREARVLTPTLAGTR